MKSFLLILGLLILSPPAEAEILIKTVAQVKNHVITSREVDIHKVVMEAAGTEFQNLRVKKPIEEVIREWLLFFEASSFYNAGISNEKVSEVYKKAKEKIAASDWKNLDLDPNVLREKIRRRMEADRLFVFKRKASVLPVSLSEIETEYTQNRVNYGNLKFDDVKEKIRQNKVEENLLDRLEQWFQVLEKKYKVQRFSQFQK